MASFVMSASAVKAPAAKVSGLGFRKAVSAVAMPVQSKPVQARAAFSVVCGKPGAKAKKRKPNRGNQSGQHRDESGEGSRKPHRKGGKGPGPNAGKRATKKRSDPNRGPKQGGPKASGGRPPQKRSGGRPAQGKGGQGGQRRRGQGRTS